MTYGHAERNLAALRLLEAETAELLSGLAQHGPEQSRWLRETVSSGRRGHPAAHARRPRTLRHQRDDFVVAGDHFSPH